MNCSPPLAPPWDERQAIAKESTLKLKAGPGRAWRTKPPHFFKGDSSGENPQVVAKLSETFRLETMFHVCCLPLFQTNSWGLNPSIGFWFQKKPSNNLRYGK